MSYTDIKTSQEWQLEFPNWIVHDPDGWDRKNFQYSWFEEKITWEEYNRRLIGSTVIVSDVDYEE